MSSRSYDIDPVLEEFPGRCGFQIFLFEGDDCVWEDFFATKEDAVDFGEDFLEGWFRDGFPTSHVEWHQERETRIPYDA